MTNLDLVLLGMPGTGKGTQAKILKEKYGIPHISTGELFREAITKKTVLGVKVADFLREGKLVPDEIVNNVVLERLKENDCRKGFLLDGYPRTVEQAKALDEALSSGGKKVKVLSVQLDEEEVLRRLSGRRICEKCGKEYNIFYVRPKVSGICDACGGKLIQRDDDKNETIKKRLEVYWAQTSPLIEYYKKKGILFTVNGSGSVTEVSERLFKVIGEK
ncbi:MAG: adenylate kinase [Thermoproteota archaeon]|nr:adenylate kinase [Thermoproteota archaeon]